VKLNTELIEKIEMFEMSGIQSLLIELAELDDDELLEIREEINKIINARTPSAKTRVLTVDEVREAWAKAAGFDLDDRRERYQFHYFGGKIQTIKEIVRTPSGANKFTGDVFYSDTAPSWDKKAGDVEIGSLIMDISKQGSRANRYRQSTVFRVLEDGLEAIATINSERWTETKAFTKAVRDALTK